MLAVIGNDSEPKQLLAQSASRYCFDLCTLSFVLISPVTARIADKVQSKKNNARSSLGPELTPLHCCRPRDVFGWDLTPL